MPKFDLEVEGEVTITSSAGCVTNVPLDGHIEAYQKDIDTFVQAVGEEKIVKCVSIESRLYELGSYEIHQAIEACNFSSDNIQGIINDLKEML